MWCEYYSSMSYRCIMFYNAMYKGAAYSCTHVYMAVHRKVPRSNIHDFTSFTPFPPHARPSYVGRTSSPNAITIPGTNAKFRSVAAA